MRESISIKRTRQTKRRKNIFILIIFLCFVAFFIFFHQKDKTVRWNEKEGKNIYMNDNGLLLSFSDVSEKTVGELLKVKNIVLSEGESVFPDESAVLFPGTEIILSRAYTVHILIDGKEETLHTQMKTIGEALIESDLHLDTDDIVKPDRDVFLENNMRVAVTRVTIEELAVDKPIAFDTKINEDSTLSWRKSIVTQKGENGVKRSYYKISRYDGKEVHRTLLKTETIQEPISQIITQGTYMKLGKKHTGGASWYAYTGTLSAANPWLPKGSFVKVTNTDNGKSVVVKINDRGPFVPGRIIDLDKVAFVKIASLGAGVINVIMEEIVNE